ncbi:hypothetical protein C8R44DRAFT_745619 [Mycena epipterygia]|nr:hypothetical protein C8R44DRAFT_745619 [Mycena epipterygia]
MPVIALRGTRGVAEPRAPAKSNTTHIFRPRKYSVTDTQRAQARAANPSAARLSNHHLTICVAIRAKAAQQASSSQTGNMGSDEIYDCDRAGCDDLGVHGEVNGDEHNSGSHFEAMMGMPGEQVWGGPSVHGWRQRYCVEKDIALRARASGEQHAEKKAWWWRACERDRLVGCTGYVARLK